VEWYQEVFVSTGRSAALWAFVGFILTFAITRGITRRIRAKKDEPPDPTKDGGGFSDIYIGGVHVHHQVWGILLVLVCGLLEFRFNPDAPWRELLAALFGAGAALTLDEFALWFHLDDVYWGEEGRKSIDAILIGGALGLVLLMEASPIGSTQEEDVDTWLYLVLVGFHLATAGVCFVKGKLATGLIGIVVPIVATVGAIRLAKPSSVWARRRYSEKKLRRSHKRFDDDYQRRRERLRDLIGGSPESRQKPTGPAAGGSVDAAATPSVGPDGRSEPGGLAAPARDPELPAANG
jgi:hypothetical protein